MNLPTIGGAEAEENGPTDAGTRAREGQLIADSAKLAAVEALVEALGATRRYWDKDAKAWTIEPDYATRIRASELILAYAEGRPVERRLEVRANAETWEAQKSRQLKSPEGIRFLLAAGAVSRKEADEAFAKLGKTPESE